MFSGVRTRVDSRRFPEIYNCCNFAFDNIENRNFIFELCVTHLKYILSLLLNCISISMRGTEHRFVINMMLLWK